MYSIFKDSVKNYIKINGESWVTDILLFLCNAADYKQLEVTNKEKWNEINNVVYYIKLKGKEYCHQFEYFTFVLSALEYEAIKDETYDKDKLEYILAEIKDICEYNYWK